MNVLDRIKGGITRFTNPDKYITDEYHRRGMHLPESIREDPNAEYIRKILPFNQREEQRLNEFNSPNPSHNVIENLNTQDMQENANDEYLKQRYRELGAYIPKPAIEPPPPPPVENVPRNIGGVPKPRQDRFTMRQRVAGDTGIPIEPPPPPAPPPNVPPVIGPALPTIPKFTMDRRERGDKLRNAFYTSSRYMGPVRQSPQEEGFLPKVSDRRLRRMEEPDRVAPVYDKGLEMPNEVNRRSSPAALIWGPGKTGFGKAFRSDRSYNPQDVGWEPDKMGLFESGRYGFGKYAYEEPERDEYGRYAYEGKNKRRFDRARDALLNDVLPPEMIQRLSSPDRDALKQSIGNFLMYARHGAKTIKREGIHAKPFRATSTYDTIPLGLRRIAKTIQDTYGVEAAKKFVAMSDKIGEVFSRAKEFQKPGVQDFADRMNTQLRLAGVYKQGKYGKQ